MGEGRNTFDAAALVARASAPKSDDVLWTRSWSELESTFVKTAGLNVHLEKEGFYLST